MAPEPQWHPCVQWKSTKSAKKQLLLEIDRCGNGDTLDVLQRSLILLELRSLLRRSWHSSPPASRLDSVGGAIDAFQANTSSSTTLVKKLCKKIGFCLGDGEIYGTGLPDMLKLHKDKRVHPRDAKDSNARRCLVVCF